MTAAWLYVIVIITLDRGIRGEGQLVWVTSPTPRELIS